MFKIILQITSIFLLLITSVVAQNNTFNFIYPLDRSPVVTGNYGEIRPNHFHAGLDFTTDPSKNLPIKSVADGFVSRIKISSGGYGKVLYITHPNGYVSVYAHQKRYASKIDAYVKQQQLIQQKNDIELHLAPQELSVKKGEVVGYTGNSGSSTGPHLHFEIRDEKTEVPINPLLIYNVKDDIKPVLTNVVFYNTEDTTNVESKITLPILDKQGKLHAKKNKLTLSFNTLAIGFSGFDISNLTSNKNNIYEARLLLDNRLIYHHQLDQISFDHGRFVNFFSEKMNGSKIQKCFAPTCHSIGIYKTLIGGGKIELKDTLFHQLELQVADEKGNKNSIVFFVKTIKLNGYAKKSKMPSVSCHQDFELKQSSLEVSISAGTLVNDAYINYPANTPKIQSSGVRFGNKAIPLMKPFKIALKLDDVINDKASKLVMTVNGDVIGGKFENQWLRAESKFFGAFNFAYDTVPPKIIFPENKNIKKSLAANVLTMLVSDNLSGIGDYHVYVNDVWHIAEYDAKSNTITCSFSESVSAGSVHVRVDVFDKVFNKSTLNISLNR